MNAEIEVKFLNVDKTNVRKNLSTIGAVLTQERTLMRRAVYEHPIHERGYVRIRDEGNKVTLTLKEVHSAHTIDGVKELELEISDFGVMKNIFDTMGIQQKTYQETFRETWQKDRVMITIDERPGLNPFIELESTHEYFIKEITKKLGFDYADAVFGTVTEVYGIELGLSAEYINYVKKLTFEEPPTLP